MDEAELKVTADDYYTPAWLFERWGLSFDLDVAAPPGGVPWVPAARYFTQADDGLAQPWAGRVFMNPPFSNPGPWVERFLEHGHGVALLPHSCGRWHTKLWNSSAALVDLNFPTLSGPRFEFVRGGVPTCVFMPVFAAGFGPECAEALGRVGRVRS